ncbi:MAG: alpha/beta hydrolase [Acidobacteria bacterium]|nr:alpha/beta hydrolase [Acidobacteriota bacterium]
MPKAVINGASLYYEIHGSGSPLVLVHEFAGDLRYWRGAADFFARQYQVVLYNARGYPPSDVPADWRSYSQQQASEDLGGLLQQLGISRAHLVGHSMGGPVALQFCFTHPERVRSLILAGVGTGSVEPGLFRSRCQQIATELEAIGMEALKDYLRGPERVQLLRKRPAVWQEFADQFMGLSPGGLAVTLRSIQGSRPSIFEWEEQVRAIQAPAFIVVGDEDDPCLDPSLFLKRCLRRSGLVVFPKTGHTLPLEEPDRFHREVLEFLKAVDGNCWEERQQGIPSSSLVAS